MRLQPTLNAVSLTLKSKKHLSIVIASSIFMMFIAILIPVILIPGNSIDYQISLFTWDSTFLTILFSILFGISVGMHSYASKMRKTIVGKHAGTGFFSIVGTLFAGKLCPMCLSVIFSFIGLGASAVFFVLSFRFPILVASMLLILVSIYFAGKSISAIYGRSQK